MSALKSTAAVDLSTAREAGDEQWPRDRVRRLERRVEREHAARHEAERLLENKSLELFTLNQRLIHLNADLELRVQHRTEELEAAHAAAQSLLDTDYLTGISNRARFAQYIDASIVKTVESGKYTGLLLIDIDDFKLVNDSYGHAYGDQILVTVARRLAEIAGPCEMVARIGGDEFAVVAEDVDEEAVVKALTRFASIFSDPILVDRLSLNIAGSMGIAVSPTHTNFSADLQRFADLALYKVKADGGGGVAIFDAQLRDAYESRQRLQVELREAIRQDQIDIWYQPIVGVGSGRVESVEALARWSDSNGDAISPDLFIQVAEQCGLIRLLGRGLLLKALRDIKPWVDRGFLGKIAFNVSPLELLDSEFVSDVIRSLQTNNIAGRHLILEVTESILLSNLKLVTGVMHKLRSHGVTFALDDFGCGYSNLSTLRLCPISYLKMDRSLLVDLESDKSARTIVRNVVSLCRDLGVRVIGEGVETEGQLRFLREAGCNAAQGFLLGRPTPAAGLERMLDPVRESR